MSESAAVTWPDVPLVQTLSVNLLKTFQLGKKKRNPNPNFLVRISSGGVRGFHVNGVGAKKFGVSFETQGSQTFGGDIQDFAGISRGCPKSLRKKCVFNSRPLFSSKPVQIRTYLHETPQTPKQTCTNSRPHALGCEL